MATALATTTPQDSVLKLYTDEQLGVIRNHVASPDFTDTELAYCLSVAKARNLDPLKKQVYFTKRRKRDANDNWVATVTVEPTIDGFRSMAEDTKEVDGYEGPFWCGADGVWHDVWIAKEPPAAAKITVYRKGCARGFTAIARYSAYVQTDKSGKPNHIWNKMPDNQLAKCAEALCLRKAFPQQLGQFYTHEEMGQVDNPAAFTAIPKETKPEVIDAPPANVRQLPPKDEKKAAPAKSESKPKPAKWTVEQPIPEVILRGMPKPVQELKEIPLVSMAIDDLEMLVEQGKAAYNRWKGISSTNPKLLALLQAILVEAEVRLGFGGDIPPPAPADDGAPKDADLQPEPLDYDPVTGEVLP